MAKPKKNVKIRKVVSKAGKTYTYLESKGQRVRVTVDNMSNELELKRTIKRLVAKNPNVSVERIIASYTENSLMGMIVNTGWTIEQVAEQLDTTVDMLLDTKNWSNGFKEFYNPITGESYEFVFRYSDDIDQVFINKLK